MGRERTFAQVDVFAARPYGGNPVAVVLDGDGLTDTDMARFATWTNLPETTYVTTPKSEGADFGLRFFSPHGELPFAGHPTLGSVHAWLESGGKPRNGDVVVLECGVGLVDVRRTADTLSFCGPALRRRGPLDDEYLDRIARGLRIDRSDILDHNWVDNGPGWAAVRLTSAADVLALEPDDARMGEFMLGVVGPYPEGSPQQLEVRAFALPIGVREDPVCGSVNAGIAQWLIDSGQAPPSYEASQGAAIGRDGILSIRFIDGNVWVGGASLTCIHGAVQL